MLVYGKIAAILSDNGSEFAKYFEEACKKLGIIQIFTRVKTPEDNPMDERFNRTLKEEFTQADELFQPPLANDCLEEANNLLTKWLIFYNFGRPHQTLDYKTPIEYLTEKKQVLAMYPSITSCCKCGFNLIIYPCPKTASIKISLAEERRLKAEFAWLTTGVDGF